MKKRIISLIVVLLLLLAVPVHADAATVASGTSGNIKWSLDDTGCLTLTGSGAMQTYSSSSSVPWYSYTDRIYKVVIGDGITTVGNYAFRNCNVVTSVTLPEGITSIGRDAFYSCERLVDITLPSTLKTIGYEAFGYCYSIESINFPDGLQTIDSSAFTMCGSLEEIVLPDSMTALGSNAFSQCDDLKRADLGNGITTIGSSAFFDSDALAEVVLPANLQKMETTVFADCDSLTSFTIPATLTSLDSTTLAYNSAMMNIFVEAGNTAYKSVDGVLFSADGKTLVTYPAGRSGEYSVPAGTETIADVAFSRAYGLTGVNLPGSLTTIGNNAFSYCSGLTEMDLSPVQTLGEQVFLSCTSLHTVTFGENLASIGYGLFYRSSGAVVEQLYFTGNAPTFDADALKYVTATAYYPSNNTTWTASKRQNYSGTITWVPYDPSVRTDSGSFGDGMSWTLDESGTLTVSGTGAMPDFSASPWDHVRKYIKKAVISEGVTTIGAYSFYNCGNLTEVTIPAGVTAIGEGALAGCANLAVVTLPESLQSLGANAFYKSGIQEIVIPDACLELGANAFYCCLKLANVTLPDGLTTIPDSCFAECDSLLSIDIPDSVTAINYSAFYGSDALTDITLPASLETYGNAVLSNCHGLQNIYIAESNPNFRSVDGVLYSEDLTVLYNYPAGRSGTYVVEEGTKTLAFAAFDGSAQLTGVTLPDSLVTVGNYAFMNCSALPEIRLGDNVTTVSSYVFYGCNKLITVVFGKNVSSVGTWIMYGTNHDRTLRQVYFTGNAPTFKSNSFAYLYGDFYYPADNATWTTSVTSSEYGGFGVLWQAHTHTYDYSADVIAPTCTAGGYTLRSCICGETTQTDPVAAAHTPGAAVEENRVDATTSTAGSYDSVVYCTVCGTEISRTSETIPALLFSITSSNMVLGNELAMNFFVTNAGAETEDYVAVVTMTFADDREDRVVEVPFAEWEEANNNRKKVPFTGIAAKEMSDNINVVIKDAATGAVVSNSYNDSIRNYALRGLSSGKIDAKTGTMLVEMLNYGAAAQGMFTYNEDDLANRYIDAYQEAYALTEISMTNNQVKGTGYKSASLTLADKISMTMVFYKTSVTDDMTAVVTFTDHYGVEKTVRIPGSEFTDRGDEWGIVINELVVADGRQMVTCTFEYADGSVVEGVYGQDSMESFCARAYGSTGKAYYQAIMKFSQAAYNYLPR